MDQAVDDMPETAYRASRVCRVIGNPTAYRILKALAGTKMRPSELAELLGVAPNNISRTLRHLREVDLVRYETEGSHKTYWHKDPDIARVFEELEALIDRTRVQGDSMA